MSPPTQGAVQPVSDVPRSCLQGCAERPERLHPQHGGGHRGQRSSCLPGSWHGACWFPGFIRNFIRLPSSLKWLRPFPQQSNITYCSSVMCPWLIAALTMCLYIFSWSTWKWPHCCSPPLTSDTPSPLQRCFTSVTLLLRYTSTPNSSLSSVFQCHGNTFFCSYYTLIDVMPVVHVTSSLPSENAV